MIYYRNKLVVDKIDVEFRKNQNKTKIKEDKNSDLCHLIELEAGAAS